MKVRKFVLGVGILIVYALALFQGIEAFYPKPQYENYCDIQSPKFFPYRDPANCTYSPKLEEKAQECYSNKGEFVYEYNDVGCPIEGYCDECRIGYETALDKYSNQIFIYSLILGFVVLLVGLYFLKKEPVGSALIASGIWTVFYGVVVNWRNFGNAWRFLLLFVLLVVLIWFALKLESLGKRKGWKFGIKRFIKKGN
ncbi:MAG: hypothetical protein Q8P57_02195 [Candidatus Pacearchaeota archaeon]|nr:hypothetical protein [Candidatus Pacearchaeota archaeon]